MADVDEYGIAIKKPTVAVDAFGIPIKKKRQEEVISDSTAQVQELDSEQEVEAGSLGTPQVEVAQTEEFDVNNLQSSRLKDKIAEFNNEPDAKKKQSFGSHLLDNLAAGSSELGVMISSIPETIYDIFSLPQNLFSKATGVDVTTSAKEFKEDRNISNPVLDYYIDEKEKLSNKVQKYQDENYENSSVWKNIKDGNYGDAFKLLGASITQSAPISLSMMAGGSTMSLGKLAGTSTPLFMGPARLELEKENPELSELEKTVKSLGIAGAETVFSSITSGTLGKVYKDILLKEGKEQGVAVFKKGLITMYEKALKKYGVAAGALGEGIEEVATQITQNIINGKDALEGVPDAFLQGVGGGGAYAAPITAIQAKNRVQRGIAEHKIKKALDGPETFDLTDLYKDVKEIDNKQIDVANINKSEQVLDKHLKNKINSGDITKDEANNITENFNRIKSISQAVEGVDLTGDQKVKAINLLSKRTELESKTKDKDPHLVKKELNEIAEINNQLETLRDEEKITKTNKSELDAKTEESTQKETESKILPTKDENNKAVEQKAELETKETTKRVKSVKNSDYDVTFDENENVTKIVSRKDGREIPKFIERKVKVTKKNPTGKKLVVNGAYSSIVADATGSITENQSKLEQKAKLDEALDNFKPSTPYEHALNYFLKGGRVKLSDAKSQGHNNKTGKWASGFKKDSELPSIEKASENIWSTDIENIDQREVRNELETIVRENSSIEQLQGTLMDTHNTNVIAQQEQELRTYLGTLSEKDLSLYEALKAEDEYVSELTDAEALEYFEQEYESKIPVNVREQQNTENDEIGKAKGSSVQKRNGSKKSQIPKIQKVETPIADKRVSFTFLGETLTGSIIDEGKIKGDDGTTYSDKQVKNIKDIDDTTHTQGFSFNKQSRDLTGEGELIDKFAGGRKFKKLWDNTFKSNQGLDAKNAEVVRSRQRDIAAYTDALNYETTQFKKMINKVKRADSKNFTKNNLAINDYLSGEDVDVSFLNAKQVKQLDYYRQRIDTLSDKLINILEGQLTIQTGDSAIERTEKLIETIKENKTKYLNRSYQIFVDDSYANKITLAEGELGAVGQNKIDATVDFLVKEEGFNKEDAKKFIAKYLDDIKRGRNDLNFIATEKADTPFFKKRKDIPQVFRELLGEAKDPIYNYVNTVYKLSGYIANLEYQHRLRTSLLDSGVGRIDPKQGYTRLTSEGDGWQTLSDIYVPNDVKKAIEDMNPLQRVNDKFYSNWLKFVSFTKFGKTIASPTTTARNLWSGILLGANSGHFFLLNPKHAATAFNTAWDTKKSFTKLKSERKKLIELGVLKDGGRSGEIMATLNDFSKETSRMVKANKFELTVQFLQKVYAFGDDFYKVAGFYIEKGRFEKSGMSEAEAETKAAERIRGGYPTYSYVPRTFQHLRRIPLLGTFISFPYEVMRTTKNNAKYVVEDFKEGRNKMASQRLAGMAVANGLLYALSEYTRALIGFDDEDDDAIRDMLPEWQTNSKLIYLGTKNGKPIFVDGTSLFPSETIFKPLQVLLENREGRDIDKKATKAISEVINPFLSADISTKTMIELFKNENSFDKKIYNGDNIIEGLTNDPDKIAHYYMRQAGLGVYNNLTEFMRANDIAPEYFGDKFTSYGREYTNRDAFLALAGFRLSTINYSNGISSVGYDIKDEFVFKRDEIYSRLKSTQSLSEETIKELISDYETANKEIYGKMINIINGARKLGMTNNEIAAALKHPGFSKDDIKQLLRGDYPKLKTMSKQSGQRLINRIKVNYKGNDKKAKELMNTFIKKFSTFNREITIHNKTN